MSHKEEVLAAVTGRLGEKKLQMHASVISRIYTELESQTPGTTATANSSSLQPAGSNKQRGWSSQHADGGVIQGGWGQRH